MRFLPFILLLSCAELRSGWVKVDFMEGHPSEYVVCHLVSKEGELAAKCVSLETVEAEMKRKEKKHQQGDL